VLKFCGFARSPSGRRRNQASPGSGRLAAFNSGPKKIVEINMKRNAILVAVSLLAIGSHAWANSYNEDATVNQSGGNQSATVTQTNGYSDTVSVNQSGEGFFGADTATVSQTNTSGNWNTAITQSGSGDVASIAQTGAQSNNVSVIQTGNKASAGVTQNNESSDTDKVSQGGLGNSATVLQENGSDNRVTVSQDAQDYNLGGANYAYVQQESAFGSTADVTQSLGVANVAQTYQSGSDDYLSISQSLGGFNKAYVTQIGNGNSSTVTQTGSGNYANITQH
jgi:trimeric autotransporter adhesin